MAGVRETKGKGASCHHCNMLLQLSHILTPPDAIRDIILSLPVVCGNCAKPVKREHMKQHKSSGCKRYIYTPPPTMQKLAVQSPYTSVNKSELQVAGSILNRYQQQAHSSDVPNDFLQIPKGSQGGKVYKYTCTHVDYNGFKLREHTITCHFVYAANDIGCGPVWNHPHIQSFHQNRCSQK